MYFREYLSSSLILRFFDRLKNGAISYVLLYLSIEQCDSLEKLLLRYLVLSLMKLKYI